MKTNKVTTDAESEFIKSIQLACARYYKNALSKNIKRGIQRKKELLATKSK